VPASAGAGAAGPEAKGRALAAAAGRSTMAAETVATASSAPSQERKSRVPRIVVPDTLRVALGHQKRARAASTPLPCFCPASLLNGAPSRSPGRARRGRRSGPEHSTFRRRLGRTHFGSRREREREPGGYVRPGTAAASGPIYPAQTGRKPEMWRKSSGAEPPRPPNAPWRLRSPPLRSAEAIPRSARASAA
jgi:hypothetical protein